MSTLKDVAVMLTELKEQATTLEDFRIAYEDEMDTVGILDMMDDAIHALNIAIYSAETLTVNEVILDEESCIDDFDESDASEPTEDDIDDMLLSLCKGQRIAALKNKQVHFYKVHEDEDDL